MRGLSTLTWPDYLVLLIPRPMMQHLIGLLIIMILLHNQMHLLFKSFVPLARPSSPEIMMPVLLRTAPLNCLVNNCDILPLSTAAMRQLNKCSILFGSAALVELVLPAYLIGSCSVFQGRPLLACLLQIHWRATLLLRRVGLHELDVLLVVLLQLKHLSALARLVCVRLQVVRVVRVRSAHVRSQQLNLLLYLSLVAVGANQVVRLVVLQFLVRVRRVLSERTLGR